MTDDDLTDAREELRRARDEMDARDVRLQLESIIEALDNVEGWEDETESRFDSMRDQLAEMEKLAEEEPAARIRRARGHLRSHQTEQ